MSRPSAIYRARAASLRNDARYQIGVARARLLARAESCDRVAASFERTEPEPITTLSRHGALVTVGPTLRAWAGKEP